MQSQTEAIRCDVPTPYMFLFATVLVTISATAMLCCAIVTDNWEKIYWDRETLDRMTSNQSNSHLQWYSDDKFARMDVIPTDRFGVRRNNSIFFVPMIGGVWSLCIDLNAKEMRYMEPFEYSAVQSCMNYLSTGLQANGNWVNDAVSSLGPHLRMQNLSISCALVCLILLAAAGLLGTFGLCQKQISAILITGVMYLLAALFALFTSMILLFKRQNGRAPSDFDGVVAKDLTYAASSLFKARIVTGSWSLDLGWCGVILSTITSFFWILLSKILRYV